MHAFIGLVSRVRSWIAGIWKELLLTASCTSSTIAIVIITQPVSWYSFYRRPTESGRLSRPGHCSKGASPCPRLRIAAAVAMNNRPRRDSSIVPLTPQSDALTHTCLDSVKSKRYAQTLGHWDLATPVVVWRVLYTTSCVRVVVTWLLCILDKMHACTMAEIRSASCTYTLWLPHTGWLDRHLCPLSWA